MNSQRRGAEDEEGAGGAGGGEAGDRPQERGVPERAQGVGGRVGNGEYFMIKYRYCTYKNTNRENILTPYFPVLFLTNPKLELVVID